MVKNKRIRKRKFYTQWDKKAKMMSRGFGQRQKQKVFYSQWAGFECPKCHQTSTEYDGYLFGAVGFAGKKGKKNTFVCMNCGKTREARK